MAKVQVSKSKLWQAVRKQCLECVCGSSEEVRLCTSAKCILYPFRFGRSLKTGDTVYFGGQKYGKVE